MGQLNEKDAKLVFKQILEGVYYLHQNNIAHRDLKPENILICINNKNESIIKISDFGIAKIIGEKEKTTTFCGTPLYLAPEIIQNCIFHYSDSNSSNNSSHKENNDNQELGYGKEADIWSLGCILYILLSGEPPFDANKVISKKILNKIPFVKQYGK